MARMSFSTTAATTPMAGKTPVPASKEVIDPAKDFK
jgi:isocitrate dehydrogenase (NAD+)